MTSETLNIQVGSKKVVFRMHLNLNDHQLNIDCYIYTVLYEPYINTNLT